MSTFRAAFNMSLFGRSLARISVNVDDCYAGVTVGRGYADCYRGRLPSSCPPMWAIQRTPGTIEIWAGRWEGSFSWGRRAARNTFKASSDAPHETAAGA